MIMPMKNFDCVWSSLLIIEMVEQESVVYLWYSFRSKSMIIIIIIIIIIIKKRVGSARLGVSENALSIGRPQLHATNP